MQWLNYHHLLYFRSIANEGGIARAAEKLRLGQPTLSSQLRQLEDTIGKPLFIRKNRKMILTEAGRAALDYANEIFRLGDEMLEVLKDRVGINQTHLQIGALDGVPKNVTLELVLEAQRLTPCTVSILEGNSGELMAGLLSHKIDLILSNHPPSLLQGDQVYSKSVAKIPVAIFGASHYKDISKSFPKSLEGLPFVLPTSHSQLRQDINQFFKSENILVKPVAETQDTSLQRLLAAHGVGLTPLSEIGSEEAKNHGLKKLGRLKGIFEEVWLIAAERKIENPVASKLMKTFSLS